MRFEILENDEAPISQAVENKNISPKSTDIARSFEFYGKRPFSPEQIEGIRKQLIQKLVTPATEFTSSALGGLGDILSLGSRYLAEPAAKMAGETPVPYEQSLSASIFPTSEQLHKGFEKLSGEKLRPETTGEEILSTGAGFLGSSFGLGGGKFLEKGFLPFITKKMPIPKEIPAIVRNVISAFGPASVLVGAEKADLPDWAKAGATVGTALLAHKFTGKPLKAISNELYKKVDDLAKDVMIPSDKFIGRLGKLKDELATHGTTGPIGSIRDMANEFEGKASGGAIPLKYLMNFKQDVLEKSKAFNRKEYKGSERFWNALSKSVDESIGDYEKLNPEFSQTYRQANSLYRGIKESESIEKFISKNKLLSAGGGLVLKYLGFIGLGSHTIPLALAGKLGEFSLAIARNPGFRKAWNDVLKNASKNEVRGTARAIKSFNKYADKEGLTKEEPVEKSSDSQYRFVEID